jgi:pimeloyl-ACP methyl ester carboxylesterase
VYVRNTGPLPANAAGEDYIFRLPDEYHHGRSYPLVVVLTDPGMPPETMLAGLAAEANKHGYILAAPKWTVGFTPPYDYTGKDHPMVLEVMRDVSRRFQVDPDRVFLFGLGSGGTLALDLGLARPDHFAGVTLFGPTPIHQVFKDTWTNAQKLPIFTVTGDRSGISSESMRMLHENWLPNGYPALFTVYRGRGAEFFQPEVPNAFDWMNRKTRARGIEDIRPANLFRTPERPGLAPTPAAFRADIRAGNTVVIDRVYGVRKLSIWLERDMIDWNQPVTFKIDGAIENPPKAKIAPDLKLMFEELYRTGDKKMLFFGKVEVRTQG